MGGSNMAGKGQEKVEPAVLGDGNFIAYCWADQNEEDVVPDPARVADTCKGGGYEL